MQGKLFDSSAIMNLIKNNELDKLLGNFTLTLAPYEVGNSLWREACLRKKLSIEDASEALEAICSIIERMVRLSIDGEEMKILKIAEIESLTYYDASYLHMAAKNGFILITDDEMLLKKAKKYVKAIKSAQV
ncbi:MAG: type II toxin-antitoxin system VapC family toxin [Candidatus Bathyarchaeia archaeon]